MIIDDLACNFKRYNIRHGISLLNGKEHNMSHVLHGRTVSHFTRIPLEVIMLTSLITAVAGGVRPEAEAKSQLEAKITHNRQDRA